MLYSEDGGQVFLPIGCVSGENCDGHELRGTNGLGAVWLLARAGTFGVT